MNEKDIIEQLVEELTPIKINKGPGMRSLLWLVGNLVLLFFVLNLISPIQLKMGEVSLHFFVEVALFFLALFTGAFFFFLSLIPGATKTRKLGIVSLGISVVLVASVWFPGKIIGGMRSYCEVEILLFSLFPILSFVYFLKRNDFYNIRWSFYLLGFSSALLCTFLMFFFCTNEPWHVFLFHLLPVFIVALICHFWGMRRAN